MKMKKYLKYLMIAFVNVIILTTFLALWTDRLELIFNDWVRPREFVKILGFTILSLISMRILIGYFRRRGITKITTKIIMSASMTILISSYLYINYSTRFVNNIILNGQFRNQIADKIKPTRILSNGTQAENLTVKEYQQITNMFWFPKLPDEAFNINYIYEYDSFLPDYLFILTYDLPQELKVNTINIKNGDYSKHQSFITIENIKRVTYSESEQ
jgi:hypothetical protein